MRLLNQYQEEEFRFVLLGKKSKRPIEKWGEEENRLKFNDPRIKNHTGNIGIIGGYGSLVIIDDEERKLEGIISQELPQTFRVLTGGGGSHDYFILEGEEEIFFNMELNGKHLGEVRGAKDKYCLIAGSIHDETGREYFVDSNKSIATITKKQLLEAVGKYKKQGKVTTPMGGDKTKLNYTEQSDVSLPLENVVSGINFIQSGSQLFGSHPAHGSKTGKNFCVDFSKQAWHCFRHDSGGDSLMLVAVLENLISCEEAGAGVLRGELFKKTLEIARKKYGAKKETNTEVIGFFDAEVGEYVVKRK